MKNDNDIKNMFIVDETNYKKETVLSLAKKLIKYAKISKTGDIIIVNNAVSPDDKLRIALSARFIAHNLDDSISSDVSLKDMVRVLPNESKEAIGSRMSKLVKLAFAKKGARGVYGIYPHRIESFLDSLTADTTTQEVTNENKVRNTRKSNPNRKNKAVTGVGKDILDLINEGFFNTPKTIKELETKLITEVKYHDPRVIDMTIRKTFVKSQKQLKRIPNTSEGKARWRYVVR